MEWNRAFSLLGSRESRTRVIEKNGVIETRKQYIDFYLLNPNCSQEETNKLKNDIGPFY
jgi:hypothetical protein